MVKVIESDLGMRFAVWSLDLAIRDFVYFPDSGKRFFFLSVNLDPLLFRFVNRARDPPVRTSSSFSADFGLKILF